METTDYDEIERVRLEALRLAAAARFNFYLSLLAFLLSLLALALAIWR